MKPEEANRLANTQATDALSADEREQLWPALPFHEWQATAETLQRWTQIVGKVRLTLSPWINHSWHVTLYLTARGLTTSPIPHGLHTFEMEFDFVEHQLQVRKSDGASRLLELRPRSVADFYGAVMKALEELELPVAINKGPNESEEATPFDRDELHCAYAGVCEPLLGVLKKFRARFCGKWLQPPPRVHQRA